MRLLDLFCGAGGAAMGYHRAGFDVIGVDIKPQKNYPFEFVQADAIVYAWEHAHTFDAVHASPPCQDHSSLRSTMPRAHGTGHLLADTRHMLEASGRPWVIENVPGAPMRADVILCGSMFGLGALDRDGVHRQLRRHRLFESSVPLLAPSCTHRASSIGVYGHGHNAPVIGVHGGGRTKVLKARGYQGSVSEARAAMGIDWMNRDELAQAIPPAYTELVGRQLARSVFRPPT